MVKTEDEIKNLISTLPTAQDGKSNVTLYQYQGFWYHPYYLQHLISAQTHFNPKPNTTTTILSSYPKSGTTWLKALCFAISTRSTHNPDQSPLLSTLPHDCVPFLELHDYTHHQPHRNSPLVGTHIPYTSLPPPAAALPCKIIYICRDPKDVFVSLWAFTRKQNETTGVSDAVGVEEAFDQFCSGVSLAGPIWDHVLGYWKASLEFPDRVLFVRYEELKGETAKWVRRMGEFMGCGFGAEEGGEVERIVELCGIERLKGLEVSKNGCYFVGTPFAVPKSSFYRKGEVGDWRNWITPEMGDRLDRIMEDRLSGYGFQLWSSSPTASETETETS